ncbi:PREDICTED: putative F-box protein At3g52320 [Camelina sativa]|uniref:F-box protein At3g52320 n=1 Tax=Camelina sativa TaxID=90675 RepID=A0ABM0X4P4_CAMSA|nr:PREDICTED: putative F-box protein At3g52320 [Camelina sativa]
MTLTTALLEIPEELLIEILIRLPAKSLMRFKCVSKIWLSLITSRYLTNRFLKPSPRRRFLTYCMGSETHGEYALLTSSNHDHSDTSVSVVDKDLAIQTLGGGRLVSSVRGLLCFKNGRRVRICNLNTRQVVELPTIKEENNFEKVLFYFGHDPVNDEYEVLTTVWDVTYEEERVMRSEHQVLVLGAGAWWKKGQCHILHRPFHSSCHGVITVNGVLYYRAWNDANKCVVMSFNLTSEDLDVWVLEDAGKSQWSDRKTFVLPDFQMKPLFYGDRLVITGTSRSGELWLSKLKNRDSYLEETG